MFYDLHVHTNESDGKYSKLQLLNFMDKQKIKVVAFCDHNICNNNDIKVIKRQYVEKYGNKLNIKIIPSIELDADNEVYRRIHILGYGLKNNSIIAKKLMDYQKENVSATIEQIDKINKMYKTNITPDMLEQIEGTEYISSKGLKLLLIKLGLANSIRDTYKFVSRTSPTHVNRKKISDIETIKLIHDAGGIAILAHPIEISRKDNKGKIGYGDEYKRYLNYLVLNGLDGVESHTVKHNDAEKQQYYQINKELGILSTAGTDFHDEIRTPKLGIDYNPKIFLFPLLNKIKYKQNIIKESDNDYER